MREHWPELERLLRQVAAGIAGSVTPQNQSGLLDSIENREFGLAYEHIGWLIENEGLRLETAQAADLVRAGYLMGLAPPAFSN